MSMEIFQQRREGLISAGFDSMSQAMIPPNAKDVPLPQNLVVDVDLPRKPFRREFTPSWVGRTPCKNKHINKAMTAIQEIVDDSDELATAGTRKF